MAVAVSPINLPFLLYLISMTCLMGQEELPQLGG